jgi:hypothetical protein
MKIGSTEHRDLFCGTFIAGHKPYEPKDLPWPDLEPKYLERLRSIPFWGIARALERKAGIMVTQFAQTLDDPIIREAVALQGVEETRHAAIMQELVDRYDLKADDLWLPQPAAVKSDWILFGYEECLDFFMGAGLFRLATELDFFPKNFVDIFEEVLFEEARHTTFFINWFRYEEARAGRDRSPARHFEAIKNYTESIKQLVRSFSGVQTTGFVAVGAGSIIENMTPAMFLEAAIAQHKAFLDRLDPRLPKPGVMPTLALTALTALKLLPPRKDTTKQSPAALRTAA